MVDPLDETNGGNDPLLPDLRPLDRYPGAPVRIEAHRRVTNHPVPHDGGVPDPDPEHRHPTEDHRNGVDHLGAGHSTVAGLGLVLLRQIVTRRRQSVAGIPAHLVEAAAEVSPGRGSSDTTVPTPALRRRRVLPCTLVQRVVV